MTDLGNTVILLLKTLKLRDYACREAEIDQIAYILLLPMMKLISTTKANIPTAVSSAYAGMELISEQNLILKISATPANWQTRAVHGLRQIEFNNDKI